MAAVVGFSVEAAGSSGKSVLMTWEMQMELLKKGTIESSQGYYCHRVTKNYCPRSLYPVVW